MKAAAEREALSVTTVLSALLSPAAMSVGGTKLHDVPAGKPEQANEMVPANPPVGVTFNVAIPDWPRGIVTLLGVAAIE